MPHRLVGHWILTSYDVFAPDGSVARPFGEAIGRICYDDRGNMAGQVMRPGRASVESREGSAQQVRAAYIGYIAYFGRYEVNEAGDTVTHHVEGALNPAWVGGQQVRQMRVEGDRLILEARVQKNGQSMRHVLTWERAR
jgi:hypothetical protein